MACGRLSVDDSPLEQWPPALQVVAAELGEFIQEAHAVGGQRHVARHGTRPPPISPASEMVWWGARHGRVVTHAVQAPVKPATW
jgi:hypothetical protein